MEHAVDDAWRQALIAEAGALGVALSPEAVARIADHVALLLKWNSKINLTRITDLGDIRRKHVLDSLAALPLVPPGPIRILDLGAGAGFPGILWACARVELRVTMVDSVGKKVGFLKAALAQLRLPGKAVQARLKGNPIREGLEVTDLVASRAFMNLEHLLPLARKYLAAGGRVLAMLGPRESHLEAEQQAARLGFSTEASRELHLPEGAGFRQVLLLVPRETPGPQSSG